MTMTQIVSAFQLGSSTVITLPKKLGIKPGQKMEIKKSKNGVVLNLKKRPSILEILEKAKGAWAGGTDWEDYQKRRKFEIEAAKKRRNAW